MKGRLILENGMIFEGKIFGELGDTVGELVFNTGMTGYQELLTDPSYKGQIVVMTYPMVGNYGVNLEDMESEKIHLSGFVIKEDAKLPNNFRCEITLDGFLRQNKVVGFKGVDTRYITQVIRENGAMKGIITSKDMTDEEIKAYFNKFDNSDSVEQVSTKEIYEIPGLGPRIALMDFGMKKNIVRSFQKRGCNLVVFPWDTTYEEIKKYNVDAVFLSNGPGDPQKLTSVVNEIKKMLGELPLIGICLGNQLLALALGGKTEKLKYGHRGCNHPVKDLDHNRIYITSQNHGYVVSEVPKEMRVSHINLNDNTIAGLKSDELNIMCVQYHPEACPGPSDSQYLFDEFLEVVKRGGKNVR